MVALIPDTSPQPKRPPRLRAAEYVRMSTEHQKYSLANQRDAIGRYAEASGLEIVRSYADEGRSGLRLKGRAGLMRLLDDVRAGELDFEVLLILDVSRWGRFQDADEGAHYEYLCRRAGLSVIYCAEPFANDGTALASIIKSIKRAMAAEFSRELSGKVRRAQINSARLGFHVGTPPPLGLRRMLVGFDGQPKCVLRPGEHKHCQGDKVILVPGPGDEVETIRRIFREFASGRCTALDIARRLNEDGTPNGLGTRWTGERVLRLLRNEKYVGTNVFNRSHSELGKERRQTSRSEWVRVEGAFEAIVPRATFDRAQQILKARIQRCEPDQMITSLRRLSERHGRISQKLMAADPLVPAPDTYRKVFGSLAAAYELAGYQSRERACYCVIEELRRAVIGGFTANARTVQKFGRTSFCIDGAWTLRVIAARRRDVRSLKGWEWNSPTEAAPDLTVVARLTSDGGSVVDFLFLPHRLVSRRAMYIRDRDKEWVEAYRHESLAALFRLAGPDVMDGHPTHQGP